MPVHRVPTREPDLEQTVEKIEKTQTIIGVVAEGPGAVIVFTAADKAKRAKPGDKETRA